MTGVWVWHIVAGVLGVLFSLSIVYQRMERTFSVHQPLNSASLNKVVGETGQEVSQSDYHALVEAFNDMIFMGKLPKRNVASDAGLTFYLHSGERVQIVMGDRFYEVRRTTKRGKEHFYGLMAQPSGSQSLLFKEDPRTATATSQ